MRTDRVFIIAAAGIVLVGLVLAFVLIGTPQHARSITIDAERAHDLQTIAMGMHERFGNSARIPTLLPQDIVKTDPVTKQPYAFRPIDAKHYALCATFTNPSETEDRGWPHAAGRTCYRFDVADDSAEPSVLKR